MKRSVSAPLRSRSRYSGSVLESALVGLGREDAEVRSTRKPRKKRRYAEAQSPVLGLQHALSAPVQRPRQEEEEDPFAHLKLLKKKKKREEKEKVSPALTRSATKMKHSAGVLEMVERTPVTRSMSKKRWKRSSLEDVGQEEVVVQKKLLFQSPKKKKKRKIEKKQKILTKNCEVNKIKGQKKGRRPAPQLAKGKKKSVKKEQPEPEAEADIWTPEQLEVLGDAKLKIPTVASNFWAQVAQYVPGKSAKECQAKTFEQFRSPPTNRKGVKRPIKQANTETNSAVPAKIARAGSNKFKKQVREFVDEYEKKHVDDLFETKPSKEGLPELPDFDSIKSPELGTPSRSFADDDSDNDDEAPGMLKKLSSRRRDDIDSYVLGINRQHVAGGGVMAGGKVRRVTTMVTPAKTTSTTSAKNKAVMLEEECGSHSLKGVVSPGGTTHIHVEKDGSSSEEEDHDDYHSSEEEEDFDLP
ncbi:hypothetical protein PRIC2_001860 [Phytophthora ramorum]